MNYTIPDIGLSKGYLEKTAVQFMAKHNPGTDAWGLAVGYLQLLRSMTEVETVEEAEVVEEKKEDKPRKPMSLFSEGLQNPYSSQLNRMIEFNYNKMPDQKSHSVEIEYWKPGAAEGEVRKLVPYAAVNDQNISGHDLDKDALRSFKLANIRTMESM